METPDTEALIKLIELLNKGDDSPSDVRQKLSDIVRTALHHFQPDRCSIVAFNAETDKFVAHVSRVARDSLALATASGWNEAHARRRSLSEAQFVERVDALPVEEEGRTPPQVAAFAALPLTAGPRRALMAVLYLDYQQPRPFGAEERAELRFFADQAALALRQTWLLNRYENVATLGQLINSDLSSVEQLFRRLRDGVRELFDTRDFFMLVLYQLETNSLDVFFTDRTGDHVKRGEPFDGASAWVIERREPKLIAHRSQNGELPFALVDLSPEPSIEESLLFVPLLFRDSCLGVLSVQHREPNFFDQDDLQVLKLLGNQVALALNTVRLFDNLSEIHATGQALLRTLDVEPSEIAQTIVEQVRRASGADIVTLYPAPGGRPAPRPAVSGTLQDRSHPRSDPPRQDDIVLLTLQGERPLYGESSTLFQRLGGHSELRQGHFEEREQVRSTAALPLRVGDEPVGALFVNYRSPQRFGAAQRRLLESLASYAAVSLRNVEAFDAINAQRIGELQALQAIDRTLAQSLDLPTVLDRILDFARERSRADAAAIVLYDEASGNLVCQAAKGDLAAERIGWAIDPQSPKSIVSWVFREGLSARVNDVHAEHPWARYYDEADPRVRAELDVPLRDADGQVIGVINLESRTPNAFGLDEKDFVETLAGQAVLAIRNAQAYERERRLADERAALMSIGKEIVGQLDPAQVFQRILSQALTLTNTTVGTLHLYDPVEDRLQLMAEHGLADQYRQAAIELEIGQGVLGQAARQGRPINVADVTQPPWDEVHLPYIPGVRAELAVPLMEGTRLRGVLNLESFTPGHFTERDERLVVAFADLALIALQNAERFQEAQNQRQRAERETERVALLYEAGRRLTAATNEPAAYEVIGQIAHEHFQARVVIRRAQPAEQLLVPALDIGGSPEHPARTERAGRPRAPHDRHRRHPEPAV
jgi:GAF domain-containing protein